MEKARPALTERGRVCYTEKMRCLFVYNPVSGKGKVGRCEGEIAEALSRRFGACDVYATRAPGELSEKAADACGRYDVLVFAGGDGSFNEVVQGLGERENRPVLGYIPTGTVNDIARSVGIPRSIRGALKNIVDGAPKRLDVMKVNDSYVMYVVASGGLTGCSYTAGQSSKKAFGKLAYAFEVLRRDLVIDDYTFRFEDNNEIHEAAAVMVMIMNSRSVASMRLNPDAVLDDGEVELVIITQEKLKHETNFFRHVRYLLSALGVFVLGYRGLKYDPRAFVYRGNRFKIGVGEGIAGSFDGERGRSGPMELTVLPRHVELIVPERERQRK